MSRQLAEHLCVKPGDEVLIEPIKGTKEKRLAPVVEIADGYYGTYVYADIEYLSRLIGEEYAINMVQLDWDGIPSHREAFYKEVKQMPALQSIASRKDMVQTLKRHRAEKSKHGHNDSGRLRRRGIFSAASSMPRWSIWPNGSARSPRSGCSATARGKSAACCSAKVLFRTMIGTVLGMPLGYMLTVITVNEYASDMFRLPIITTPDIWYGTLIFAVIFAVLAHLAVQRAIHKMDWLDALKVQE